MATSLPESINVVIDLSHHNGDVDLAQAAADGILGVIQKATQGTGYQDPTYRTNHVDLSRPPMGRLSLRDRVGWHRAGGVFP